ncbi:uncharacterized protein LOC141855168 [Brevipalpus obovatus]|uniref:uncharacterized protein LOC141855168 n=1 Tax=Brevipalpus obovatus TaxID=246614 RepID=UPI003D9F04C6
MRIKESQSGASFSGHSVKDTTSTIMGTTAMKWLLIFTIILVKTISGKEIDSKTDLLQEESSDLMAEHRSAKEQETSLGRKERNDISNEVWPGGRSDVPQIKNINVKCEKNHMKVNIEFDRPFYGIIFSKGHYNDGKCVHLPAGSGHLVSNFDIFLGACGMTSSDQVIPNGQQGAGLFIENTLVIQYDPQVQEIWDQARRLRCTWYDFYEKSVSFRPFNVDMMDAVTANFLGDNIQCWMQIQAGKGPWASEVTGIVKIGQTMTMVLAIKDDENKFDMLVRNCVAHDGKNQPIQLIDDSGCVQRPKIISKFQKVKNFGTSATVVSYAYFQAFKFPDSMNVHFQCVIQVCRYECPEPKCPSNGGAGLLPPDDNNNVPIIPREPSAALPPKTPQQQQEESRIAFDRRLPVGIDPSRVTILKIPASSTGNHFAKATSNMFMKRQADSNNGATNTGSSSYYASSNRTSILSVGGKPRHLVAREKRQAAMPASYTDIKTGKIIHVVAPGDVEFNLPGSSEENRALSSIADEYTQNLLCMSTANFLASLVTILTVLCISTIIAVFFYLRVRTLSKTNEPRRNSDMKCHQLPSPPLSTYLFPN